MRRGLHWVYAVIIWLLMIGMVIQVFLAGYGAFGGGFDRHRTVGWLVAYAIGLLVIVSVIASLAAGLSWRLTGTAGGLAVLWIVQLVLAHTGVPAVAGLHALNALAMLGVGGFLAGRARMMVFGAEVGGLRTGRRAPST